MLLIEVGDLSAVDKFHRQHLRRGRIPINRRNVNIRPILKTLAKTLGIFSLGDVIHFLMDRYVKFAQHSGPVGIFVELRETFGKFRDLFENDNVAFDRRFEIGPLDLDGDLLAGMKSPAIDLAKRCGGDGFEFEFGVNLVDLAAQLVFDPGKGNIIRKRRHAVDQCPKFLDKRQGQKVGPRTHRLADLDKRRPQLDQLFPQPDGLLLLIRLFICSVADKESTHQQQRSLKRPEPDGIKFFAINRQPRQPRRTL